jgi:hypothetical protein
MDKERTQAGVPRSDGGVLIANFNQQYKVTPQVFDAWMMAVDNGSSDIRLWQIEYTPEQRKNVERSEIPALDTQNSLDHPFPCRKPFDDQSAS